MTLQQALARFLFEKRLQDLSVRTIQDYSEFLNRFVRYIGPDRNVEDVCQQDLETYIFDVVAAPLSKATKATYIRHMKVFLKWAQRKYVVSFNAADIMVPRANGRHVRIYSEVEVRQIFAAVSYGSIRWLTYRDKALVALMLDSGLRQSEVCSVMRKDFYDDGTRLVVHGKGGKYRVVPVGKMSRLYVEWYLMHCPYRKDWLFCDKSGDQLSRNAVKLLIGRLAKRLPFELSSHKLRHNFATNWCIDQYEKRGSVDLVQLMYIMGHSDVKTTQRYLHLAMELIAGDASVSHLDKIYK